jgi:hypothetical protein
MSQEMPLNFADIKSDTIRGYTRAQSGPVFGLSPVCDINPARSSSRSAA